MAFNLRKATQDDVDQLCQVYLAAFHDEIFNRQVFPQNTESSLTYWRNAFSEELNEPHATTLVLTDPASPTPEQVIGFVKWVAPGAALPEYTDEWYPPEGNPELAVSFYRELFAGHHRNMGGIEAYWYLDMMGVRPEYRGRGAARQLMDWGFKLAKADGITCFVESTSAARPFYERFGFEENDRMCVDSPEGVIEVFFMLRNP